MKVAILHYSAPPVPGGVEAVIEAHARQLLKAGYSARVVAGRGEQAALPHGAELILIPEMDSSHVPIAEASAGLERGRVPANFGALVEALAGSLEPVLAEADVAIVHNIFTKHFNLPLTAALVRLMERGANCRWIAWCHDISWTSPNSKARLHVGEPWELLRRWPPRVLPVAVSRQRQVELAGLYRVPEEQIRVIYNGVDPQTLLGLSAAGLELLESMDLLAGDLNLLMPVRITQAKNIELALRVTVVLKESGIDPRLVVTGPPELHDVHILAYYRRLKDLRAELGLEKEAHFASEMGREAGQSDALRPGLVGELYRVCDVMFMPSHREGFGMPVLEAGLAGLQVFSSQIPAARELAGQEVIFFSPEDPPESVARQLLEWAGNNKAHRLRRRVRQEHTWQAIFRRRIEPLLQEAVGA